MKRDTCHFVTKIMSVACPSLFELVRIDRLILKFTVVAWYLHGSKKYVASIFSSVLLCSARVAWIVLQSQGGVQWPVGGSLLQRRRPPVPCTCVSVPPAASFFAHFLFLLLAPCAKIDKAERSLALAGLCVSCALSQRVDARDGGAICAVAASSCTVFSAQRYANTVVCLAFPFFSLCSSVSKI